METGGEHDDASGAGERPTMHAPKEHPPIPGLFPVDPRLTLDAHGSACIVGYGSSRGVAAESAATTLGATLRDASLLKLMAKQDRMALAAGAAAVAKAGLDATTLKERTGIYLVTGRQAFEDEPLDRLFRDATPHGTLDMTAFSTTAFFGMRPLQTFKCLTYIPLFHLAYNLGIHGPYFVTYPGEGQWLSVLQRALEALADGEVDCALVGAVADQDNYLVREHLRTMGTPGGAETRGDGAVFIALTSGPVRPVLATLKLHDLSYDPDAMGLARPVDPDAIDAGCVTPALRLIDWLEHGDSAYLRERCGADGMFGEWEARRP